METWGAAVLGMTVEAGLVGLVLVLAVLFLRPTPRWRAGLLLVGLLQFLVPPVLQLPVAPAVLTLQMGGDPTLVDTATALSAVGWLHAAGLSAGILLLVRSAAALGRIVRGAERVREGRVHASLRRVAAGQGIAVPRLYLTDEAGPAAAGVLHPAVLVPRSAVRALDDGGLRMVLAHEAAHLARRDPLMAAIRRLVLTAWWFHPVAWLLALMHRAAAEDVCDDAAMGRGRAGDYCAALLSAAGGRAAAAPLGCRLGEHPLERRIRRLHRSGRRPGGRWRALRRRLLVTVAAAGLVAAPVGFPALEVDGAAGPDRQIVIRHVVR
jgi:beta-lactamase regulating signal transducer with metallopeptidase domain